jgi:pilus assembly protein CpaF
VSLAERLAKSERTDRIADVQARIQVALVEGLGPKLYDATMSDAQLQVLVQRRLRELLDEEEVSLTSQEKAFVIQQIGDSVLGLGPLEPYVRDPSVTEIMVNNASTIYVERAGKIYWTGAKFLNEEQLRRTIDKIVARIGRRVDEASPYVDARLPDGSRVNAIIPPLALDGPALTSLRSGRCPPPRWSSSAPAWPAALTSWCREEPAPARPRRSTSSLPSFPRTSGS